MEFSKLSRSCNGDSVANGVNLSLQLSLIFGERRFFIPCLPDGLQFTKLASPLLLLPSLFEPPTLCRSICWYFAASDETLHLVYQGLHANHRHSNSRLARRGGVKRISAGIYDEIRGALNARLRQVRLSCCFETLVLT